MSRAAHKLINALAFMAAMWLLFFAMVALAKISERPQHLPQFKVSLSSSAVVQVATVNAQPPKSLARWLVASGRDTGLAFANPWKGESTASPTIQHQVSSGGFTHNRAPLAAKGNSARLQSGRSMREGRSTSEQPGTNSADKSVECPLEKSGLAFTASRQGASPLDFGRAA